jgi:hypothetical protein
VAIAASSVFVGRQHELRALRDAFVEASGGRSHVVVVEGEAGIGKTTLVERFLGELQAARVLRASGDESESHVPFAMADQLLRCDGRSSDALRAGRHVAVGLELLELISSGPDDAPCVVVVDDAHLIDAESLRALLFAARRLLASRALVLLVVRGTADDALPEGWRKLAGGVLTLGPLAPAHISELGLALGVAMTPDAAGRLWEHTGGSPLHARAVLRELPEDGSWQYEPRPLPVTGVVRATRPTGPSPMRTGTRPGDARSRLSAGRQGRPQAPRVHAAHSSAWARPSSRPVRRSHESTSARAERASSPRTASPVSMRAPRHDRA